MSIKSAKAVIFDFDGTLCDDFRELIVILNSMAKEFGYEKTPLEKIPALRELPSQDLFCVLGVTPEKLGLAVKNVVTRLASRIHGLPSFPGLVDVLRQLSTQGYRLGILTSNSEEIVRPFLLNNRLDFVEFIYSQSGVFDKHRMIANVLEERELDKSEIIYVGDETRDIEAARKAGVAVIAVSWGFNARAILEKYQPDFIVDKPVELLEVLSDYHKKGSNAVQ